MDAQVLKLSHRTVVGKKVNRLRKQGILPVHIYGRGVESQPLQADAREMRRLLPQVGTNIPLSIEIEGESGENICFVREVQRHPVTEDFLHVDFIRVDVTLTIRAEVPITLVGDAPAVRQGGTLLQPMQSILVEALPMYVPSILEVDVSTLDDFDKAVYVRDVSVGARVTVISDPDDMIARVNPPRVETEETYGSAEAGELEAGADGEGAADEGGAEG